MSARALFLSSLGLLGCCSGFDVAAQSPDVVVRDSGGVRIVEHRNVRRAAKRIRLKDPPSLILGGDRPADAETFDARQPYLSLVELKGGGFVVNDLTALKFFSRNGVLRRVVGRRGAGPGEFQQVREICVLRGDSLLVIDAATGRLSLWDSAGRHVATHSRFAFIPRGSCTDRGSVIVRNGGTAAVTLRGSSYAQYDEYELDGTRIRGLGLLPFPQSRGPIIQDMQIVSMHEQLWIGDPQAGEVRTRKHPGEVHTILRLLDPRPKISEQRWREEIGSMFPKTLPKEKRDRAIERVLQLPRPVQDPAFLELRVDPDGRCWMNDYRERARWTVFDARGGLIGELLLPEARGVPGPQLVGVLAGGRVVILARTADGFPELRIHEVEAMHAAATSAPTRRDAPRLR